MKLNDLNNKKNGNQKVKIEANNIKELQEQLNKIINDLKNEKKERIEQNKEITNKIESMELEIDSLKKELNIIQIRDQIKNILNSFHYLLSPNDIDDIEKKLGKEVMFLVVHLKENFGNIKKRRNMRWLKNY